MPRAVCAMVETRAAAAPGLTSELFFVEFGFGLSLFWALRIVAEG